MSGETTRSRPALGGTGCLAVVAVIAWLVAWPDPVVRLTEAVVADGGVAGRLRADLRQLPTDRALGSPGHAATRRWLDERVSELGLELQVHEEWWPGRSGGALANLEAILGAPTGDAPIVLVTAHYDGVHGSPGADDNGSGVVVLLELARRLVRQPTEAEVRLVWFDGEEQGLLGSMRYVGSLSAATRHRIVGVINLESVGYVSFAPASQRLPPGVRPVFDPGEVGDFILLVSNLASREVLERVAVSFRAVWSGPTRVERFGWVPGKGWVLPDIRRSDHAPFWDAGIPAVLVTDTADFRNPHYHRAGDTSATLDYDFLANVALGVEQSVRELSAR